MFNERSHRGVLVAAIFLLVASLFAFASAQRAFAAEQLSWENGGATYMYEVVGDTTIIKGITSSNASVTVPERSAPKEASMR